VQRLHSQVLSCLLRMLRAWRSKRRRCSLVSIDSLVVHNGVEQGDIVGSGWVSRIRASGASVLPTFRAVLPWGPEEGCRGKTFGEVAP